SCECSRMKWLQPFFFSHAAMSSLSDGNPTIRGYKFPALPMLDILDVGEARVFQFFCYCVGHDRLIAWFRSAGAAWSVTGNKVRDGKNAPHLQAGHKTGH